MGRISRRAVDAVAATVVGSAFSLPLLTVRRPVLLVHSSISPGQGDGLGAPGANVRRDLYYLQFQGGAALSGLRQLQLAPSSALWEAEELTDSG